MTEFTPTYQEVAYETAIYGIHLEYPFTSLAEEAGEVLGKLNKYVRKYGVSIGTALVIAKYPAEQHQHDLRAALIKELSDVQWNLAACCTELDITLEELQAVNLEKLGKRAINGTLEGEGDDR